MIARRVAPKRKSRVKNVNRRRKASEFKRAYGSKERVEFVQALPCVGCTRRFAGLSVNHHIETGGAGRKADATLIVPVCCECHDEIHQHGRAYYELKHGVELGVQAALTEQAWQAHLAPDPDDAFSMASQDEMGEPHTPAGEQL